MLATENTVLCSHGWIKDCTAAWRWMPQFKSFSHYWYWTMSSTDHSIFPKGQLFLGHETICSNMSPLDWRNVCSTLWMAKAFNNKVSGGDNCKDIGDKEGNLCLEILTNWLSGSEFEQTPGDSLCLEILTNWLSGSEFEQTPGDSEGRGSLACCRPRGPKESDTT